MRFYPLIIPNRPSSKMRVHFAWCAALLLAAESPAAAQAQAQGSPSLSSSLSPAAAKREMMKAWNGLKRALLLRDAAALSAARADALPHAAATPALAKLVKQADTLLATMLPVGIGSGSGLYGRVGLYSDPR